MTNEELDELEKQLREEVNMPWESLLHRDAADAIAALVVEASELRELLIDTTASLTAAHSLLKRGGKKAAPSDKMFEQMLLDYEASADRARAALTKRSQRND